MGEKSRLNTPTHQFSRTNLAHCELHITDQPIYTVWIISNLFPCYFSRMNIAGTNLTTVNILHLTRAACSSPNIANATLARPLIGRRQMELLVWILYWHLHHWFAWLSPIAITAGRQRPISRWTNFSVIDRSIEWEAGDWTRPGTQGRTQLLSPVIKWTRNVGRWFKLLHEWV